MKKKTTTSFVCSVCGHSSPRWAGKCLSCNSWGTYEKVNVQKSSSGRIVKSKGEVKKGKVSDFVGSSFLRMSTGIGQLDGVLGGGVVAGSVILIGGEPGIGKSTLLAAVAQLIEVESQKRVLYVSGEESYEQVSARFVRLFGSEVKGNIYVVESRDVDEIIAEIESEETGLLVIDSIQTLGSQDVAGVIGGVTQVRESLGRLIEIVKSVSLPTFIVGHVTKEGLLAGPKTIEHMVDTVVYFESDMLSGYRLIRCTKNRYGEVGRVGTFKMEASGLSEIADISKLLVSNEESGRGVARCVVMEGIRPILVEIEALVGKTSYSLPKRVASGIMIDRLNILVGVMGKYLGVDLSGHDLYVNVSSGLKVKDPAIDLALCVAILSSFFEKSFKNIPVVIGEVGLTGAVKEVRQVSERVREARRLGAKVIYVGGDGRLKNVRYVDEIGVLKKICNYRT